MLDLALALVERIRPGDLLRSPIRTALLRAVVDKPGLSLSELAARLSLHPVSVHYHVERMEEAGYLRTIRVGRRRLAYPPGPVEPFAEDRAILLEPTTRRVALAIAHRPHRSILDITDDVGETARVVYHHVKRLRDVGLVTGLESSRHRGLAPTPRLLALLAGGP